MSLPLTRWVGLTVQKCEVQSSNSEHNGNARVQVTLGIDSIDYVTEIGNAHAHNGVHSVLRLGSQLLVVLLTFL